jgi:Arc/MetJ-type ribon-helix-helix transcriptional regulator
MAEKKLATVGVRMDEQMVMQIKRVSDAKGITESDVVRMAVSKWLDDLHSEYIRLDSIFGASMDHGKENIAPPRFTSFDVDFK